VTFRLVYRLQPWAFVDRLVFERCPPEFQLTPMERNASLEERQAKLAEAEFLMGSWVTTAVTLTEDDFRAGRRRFLGEVGAASRRLD